MIDQVQVSNIALIKDADIRFSEGLTAITGETGSGKTALLSSLKLLVGERLGKDIVRDGEQAARVDGRFYLPSCMENGLLVSRTVSRDGRSRVSIDGKMTSVKQLTELLGSSVDLCGQHENQRLLKTAVQMQLLDSWIGDDAAKLKASYGLAYDERRSCAEELDRIALLQASDDEQLDQARFVLRRIGEVNPQEGEYEELLLESKLMENSESLARYAEAFSMALGSESGALSRLAEGLSALEGLSSIDARFSDQVEPLRDCLFIAEDVAREVSARRTDFEFDPFRFEELQERIVAFQGLMRSYGPTMDRVFEARDRAKEIVSVASGSKEALERATFALDKANEKLRAAGEALTRLRRTHEPVFMEAVRSVLVKLEMGESQLVCEINALPFEKWTSEGPCAVEFMFIPAADMSPRPLRKIASGGELSRVMLAIKAALGGKDEGGTLVFDEIDAGVGGKTALSLAEVLKDLSTTHQVIVVTHLAQIAVAAQTHMVVRKDGDETVIHSVEGQDRQHEIARMLSGNESEASLLHARELLEGWGESDACLQSAM